jgi:hypothetical protein
MLAWVVYGFAFSQIVLLYGFFFALSVRLSYEGYMAKNRQWVAEHPAFQQRFPRPRYSIWLSYLVGAAWIAFLIRVFFIAIDKSWLVKSLALPATPFVALWLLYVGVEYFRVYKRIPLPDKRRTSLDRREMRDFFNPLWVYCGYLLVAGIVATNAVAFCRGAIDFRPFLSMTSALSLGALVLAIQLRYSLRRKNGPMDELMGSGYRSFEVILEVSALYLLMLLSGLGTLHFVFRVPDSSSPVAVALALDGTVQLLALYCLLGMPLFPRKGSPGATRGPSPQLSR